MVYGLVQHKAKDTHAVGHGHTHIPLLLKQLIQPHPLKNRMTQTFQMLS